MCPDIKPPNAWGDDEKAYLKRHWGVLEDKDIAAHLRRPLHGLGSQARRLGVTKKANRARRGTSDPQAHRAQRTVPGPGLHDIMATTTPYGPPPIPALGATARAIIANSSMRGDPYPCPELRPYDGRPGAMDAFTLPSRVGAQRTYRDGRAEAAP